MNSFLVTFDYKDKHEAPLMFKRLQEEGIETRQLENLNALIVRTKNSMQEQGIRLLAALLKGNVVDNQAVSYE
jgi:hypothetical protein